MLQKIYGIDYDTYVGAAGINKRIVKEGNDTLIFYDEPTMLKQLAELKESYLIEVTSVFTSIINREKYKINQ